MLTKPGNLEIGNAETSTALKILVSPPCKQACCENQDYISYMPCLARQGQGLEEAHHCLGHDAHTCTHGTTCTCMHILHLCIHMICAHMLHAHVHTCVYA